MSRVYVTQVPMKVDESTGRMKPRFDTMDHLVEFGETIILMERGDDIWNPDACVAKLRRALRGFSKSDYLLAMGNFHFVMWATAIIMETQDQLQTLQWNPRKQAYQAVTAYF